MAGCLDNSCIIAVSKKVNFWLCFTTQEVDEVDVGVVVLVVVIEEVAEMIAEAEQGEETRAS